MKTTLSLALTTLLSITLISAAPKDEETFQHQSSPLSITIYNESLALINEERTLSLNAGTNTLSLENVSAQIRPETVELLLLRGDGFQLIEQNFDYDLLNRHTMLEKAVGNEINVIRTNPKTGEETVEKATVLANNHDVVLQYVDRIEAGLEPSARFAFTSVPQNLRARPTLSVLLNANTSGNRLIALNYLTTGFSWKADYTANLANDEKTLDLSGWITLTNRSGSSFYNAKVQLVAGNINLVQQYTPPHLMRGGKADNLAMYNMMESGAVTQESFSDYHLYSLPLKTSILNNQEKQIALLNASHVPLKKEYRFYSTDNYFSTSTSSSDAKNIKAKVYLKLKNSEENNLGIPLPKGVFRVYQQNSDGLSLFIGEDIIDHTSKNELFEIKTGEAFDVSLSRKQTDGVIFSPQHKQNSQEIIINNAKDTPVDVLLYETFPTRHNWSIIEESTPHTKFNASTALWTLTIPANTKKTVTYTIDFRKD